MSLSAAARARARCPVRAAPAQQQPGPFELVPGLDDAACDARRRIPFLVEEFAQRAARRIDELAERQLGDFIGQRLPQRALRTHLATRERGFEQVHVRIRLQRQARRHAGFEARALPASCA